MNFILDAYHKIRDNYFLNLPDDKRPWVNIMGGFKPNSDFYGYMSEPNFHHVSLDQHLYQCFGPVRTLLLNTLEMEGTNTRIESDGGITVLKREGQESV